MRRAGAPTTALAAGAPRGVRVAVAAAVLAAHLVVLYSPRAPSVGSGVRLDLLVHVGVFAAVALTARWVGFRPRTVTVVLVVEALLSETVQALWLRGRTGDLADLVADAVGIAAGLRAWTVLVRRPGPAPGARR